MTIDKMRELYDALTKIEEGLIKMDKTIKTSLVR